MGSDKLVFTGIVEEIGSILNIRRGIKSSILTIKASKVMEDVNIGDSIAVNGVCLTVVSFAKDCFTADVMSETLNRSSLGNLSIGSEVNLERALSVNSRFGGHIVSGHIDGTGTIISIRRDDNAVWYEIKANRDILKYIIEKGSITIDGISLTVAKVMNDRFSVSIIPHTFKNTILHKKNSGEIVNLENDIIGKYIDKFLNFKSEEQEEDKITMDFLIKSGF